MLIRGVTPIPPATSRCLSAPVATVNRLRGWLISNTLPTVSSWTATEPPRPLSSSLTATR